MCVICVSDIPVDVCGRVPVLCMRAGRVDIWCCGWQQGARLQCRDIKPDGQGAASHIITSQWRCRADIFQRGGGWLGQGRVTPRGGGGQAEWGDPLEAHFPLYSAQSAENFLDH